MVRSGRAPIVCEVQVRNLLQTKSVVDVVAQAVLFNAGFNVSIPRTVEKIERRAGQDCSLPDIEEASATTVSTDLSSKCASTRRRRLSKEQSESESQEEKHRS